VKSALDELLGEQAEPAFDMVDPGRAGEGEVQVEPRVAGASVCAVGPCSGVGQPDDQVDLVPG
jgi:hypothetical protein